MFRSLAKYITIITIAVSTFIIAGDDKVTEAQFKVDGVCGLCKTRIEKSLKIKEVKIAKWDKDTKTLKVAFLSDKITADSLLQRVAAVGHDNEKYKATDEVYASLHKCCLYREMESH